MQTFKFSNLVSEANSSLSRSGGNLAPQAFPNVTPSLVIFQASNETYKNGGYWWGLFFHCRLLHNYNVTWFQTHLKVNGGCVRLWTRAVTMSHCLANSAIDSLCGVHWQGCGCVNDIHKINFDVDACRPHFCPIAVFNLCIMYKMHVALPRVVGWVHTQCPCQSWHTQAMLRCTLLIGQLPNCSIPCVH